jgi:hypothetical protein
MLQTSATICSSGNQLDNEVCFFAIAREISVCNQNPPKLSQHSTQNTDNETSNHPGSMGFATRSLRTNIKLNSRNDLNVSVCDFFPLPG